MGVAGWASGCVLVLTFMAAAATQAPPMPAGGGAPIAPTVPLGSGRYRAVMTSEPTLATHTVYRPADLAALENIRLPIVVWGNGGCVNEGNRFRWFLSEIASYGFLVIAAGPVGPASAESWPAPDYAPIPAAGANAPRRELPPPATHSVQLLEAINWAVAENERPGGRYFHRLDPQAIAAAGQSCGGVQALEVSRDPRITTTVVLNSGLLPEPTGMGGGKTMSKADLASLHAPIAYISGDAQDIAFFNANDDFERVDSIPALRAYELGVPHSGTYGQPEGGEFGGVVVAWLQWQLQHDAHAGRMFTGAECGLCVNPRWVVRRKKIP